MFETDIVKGRLLWLEVEATYNTFHWMDNACIVMVEV